MSELGKWLSNTGDPSKPHFRLREPEQERDYRDWINRNVIGPPKATEAYTVEQLEAMGMVGIYARPE